MLDFAVDVRPVHLRVSIWAVFALITGNRPVILANGFSLTFASLELQKTTRCRLLLASVLSSERFSYSRPDAQLFPPLLEWLVPAFLPALQHKRCRFQADPAAYGDCSADHFKLPRLESESAEARQCVEQYVGGKTDLGGGNGQYPRLTGSLGVESTDHVMQIVS